MSIKAFKIVFSLSFLFLVSCEKHSSTHFEGIEMHIPYRIEIAQNLTKKQSIQIVKEITDVFALVNEHFNNWNPNSEISKFNDLKSYHVIKVSDDLCHLLSLIDPIYQASQHRFDPTVAPLISIWQEAKKQGAIPSDEHLTQARSLVGWHHVHNESNLFWKDLDGVKIDLCGIAKGYAVDLIHKKISEMGLSHFYIEWGGEIVTEGHPYHKKTWTIKIDKNKQKIHLCEGAVATSGTYRQKWEIQGTLFSHIIHPLTLSPLTGQESTKMACVKADQCFLADALATTLLLFDDPEEALQWLKTYFPKAEVWFNDDAS